MEIIDCPSKEFLSAFALGNLTEVEVDLVAEHLDSCPACCEQLRRLDERVDTMIVELRRRLAADRDLSKDGSTTDFDRESARGFSVGAPLDLDDFRIVREIGRGGMGIVYEAFQGSLNRHVALKFLPEHGDLARFQREARAAGRLHHTNIVPVFGIGEHKGRHFYVMQFIAGRGFDVVRREWAQLSAGSAEGNRPDCRAVARLGIQVADALAYAHAQGVQHRDIKPSNLLLDTGGTVWVADFGLAKDAANNETLTHTGDFLGTLRYTPPERLSGRGDERGDIYSLGLTIYELLTGRPAFHEEERAQLLDQVLHSNPPSPRQCDPSISRDMETIVLKAMAREPDQRYATAAAMAEDLRRFVEDRPIRARRASLTERLLRWRRRNPAVAGLLAALIVVLLAGFAAVTWQWRTAVAEREQKEDQRSLADSARLKAQAEETKAIESREQAKRSLYYSLIDRARLERQSNNVAEAESILDRCPTERRGWEWHFLKGLNNAELFNNRGIDLVDVGLDRPKGLNNAEPFKLPGHSGAGWVDAVAYSPDGRLIASAGGGNPYYQTQGAASIKAGEVILWDAETGRPLRTLREHNHLILNLAISPDGRLLASVGLDGTVKLHEIATGNLIRTLVVASSRGVDPRIAVMGCPLAFNHDSKRLATGWYQDRLAIWDLTSGERVVTLESCVDGYGQAAFSPDGRRLATASSINAASDGGEVRLWDPDSGKELIRFDRRASIAHLAFSTDSRTLAGANRDGVFLFDLVAGQLRRVLTGHTAAVSSVAFSPDGLHVASGGADATIRIWGIDSGGTERVIRGHTERIESIAYSPDGQRLASGSRDGLKVWDLTFDPEIADIAISQIAGGLELTRSSESIAYSADGHEIVSIDRDGRVVRLESMTHSLIDQMGTDVELGFFTPAAPACFSGDGSRLVLIDPRDRRQALLLRSRKNSTPIRLRGHEFPLRWLTLSADCSRVATSAMLRVTDPSGPQSETMVWDDAGNSLFHRSAASELPRQVALDPSGRYLAMAGVRLAGQAEPSLIPFMIVVDVDARNEVMRVDPLEDECLALSFSPDGSRLAGAGLHRSLWIWQFQDRRLLATSPQAP
jgi:eukaryotic-like serine/threonine-protein kinase